MLYLLQFSIKGKKFDKIMVIINIQIHIVIT